MPTAASTLQRWLGEWRDSRRKRAERWAELPTVLRLALYVVVPLTAYGLLVGGFFLKRWHDESRQIAAVETMRREVNGQLGQMGVLVQQLQAETIQAEQLQNALQALPPDDPRRPAVAQQLAEAKTQVLKTQAALFGTPWGGGALPKPGTCDCRGDPYCDCIH